MKKIININLSGRVVPIEDSAYEKLQAYIESLRRYFANEEGRDEIINDIESRIAELMSEKIRLGSSAVTDADVSEIISSMGTVEDFEAAEKEETTTASTAFSSSSQQQQNTGYEYTSKRRGRLYRDTNDKILGGVCSGIANHINVDPAIVRLLFAIISFGAGIGFLAYIILWIVLPPKDLDGYSGKRLYRNPDDKVIGGVAGGLAAYFNTKASTIRLIFVAPLLLNILIGILNGFRWHYDFDFALNIGFGSLTGTFILTYIVLWIVLPDAVSDYQKMEMRGETVDVNRIRQNVKEGMENMKSRMKDWGQEVKTSAQNLSNKTKAFAEDARSAVRRNSGGFGHVIGVIFKAFLLFIAGSIAFGLFVGFIALIFGGVAWWPVNNYLWTSKWQQLYAWGTLIFFIGVPLIGFIVWVIRRVIRVKSRNNYLGWTFAGLWLIGWVAAVLFASSISRDFSEYRHDDTAINLTQPANGKMIVAVSQPELEFNNRFWWVDEESKGWDLSSDTLKLSTVRFDVKASTDAAYHVNLKKYSYGRSEEDAMERAKDIQYSIVSKDSVLDLGSGYTVSKDKKFRLQQVEIEIMVPVGKKIRFDESVKEKLNPTNFRIKKYYRKRKVVNIEINDDRNFRFRTGVDYTMNAGGQLAGPDDTVTPSNNNDYRYEKKDSIDVDKEIEKKKKELKELEDKKNKQQPGTTMKKIKQNNNSDLVIQTSTPGLSVIQFF
ncbi:MAG: PspC domain-containing protein [Sphingobacteriales bacterium]|nr:PspC domain-containing protein [Sphingobacteriales bacterium]